ncbi:MAG: hypothetical protein WC674_05355 [Candidatus Krumholzibacteriia bacterium]
MPSGADAEKTATQGPVYPRETLDGQKSYRVIIEDITSGIETTDSFAIKLSLLTKTPISKMKHVVRCLPAPIWSGQGRSGAEHILALIEEAGGRGSIVETGGAPPASPAGPGAPREPVGPGGPAKPAKSKSTCRWCGFPMKEEETRCGFCMMSVRDVERREHKPEPRKRAKVISRKRLICWAAVIIVVIMVIIKIIMG